MASELNASNFKGEPMMVEIEGLTLSSLLQARDLSNPDDKKMFDIFTADVAEAVKRGDEIPRIFVGEIGPNETMPDGTPVLPGRYVLDGFRRTKGFKAAGRAKIPASVRKVTWQEAVDVATSANSDQVAVPRTPADKRKAVEMSLRNHWMGSVRWHAGHCKVSQTLVEAVKKAIEKDISPELVEASKKERVGKDGKKQPVKKKAVKEKEPSADWSGMETRLGWLSRFIDAAADLEGKPKNFKEIEKAMTIYGELMLEWRDSVIAEREAREVAEKQAAEAKKEAAKAKAEKTKE